MNYRYFDNASTTKASTECLNEYNLASLDFFNPSALYKPSLDVKFKIESCRNEILEYFNARNKSKFIFTSCATESNNAVLRSCIKRKDKKYIVSAGEHSSIYNTAKAMINEGYNIDFAPLKSDGCVDEEILYSMVDEKTDFVSIIHVSNETGAINDIKTITRKLKSINPNIIVHSDGVQAMHKFDIDLEDLGVDFYTISSHKINGVKGIAGLYIAPNVRFSPFILGGGQENGFRSGTENYPAIKAFTTAILTEDIDTNKMQQLKDLLIKNLSVDYKLISNDKCVPNIISIAFPNVRGETLLHQLEDKGFIVGTGSACNSKDVTNRVLNAMGVSQNLALGNIRISFGNEIEEKDIKELAEAINDCVNNYLNRTLKR